ncbi:MAG: DNA-binding IclR family transcriptional regulator [Motiliproteus sp.]|jgi:DNA-binding IclR family transcriptional regulator
MDATVMNNAKPEARIQVIDRAALLLDTLSRYSKPVRLKVLSADTGLHPSTAHRILHSLIANRFVSRDAQGDYQLGQRLLQLSNRLHSDVDLREVSLPYMQQLRDKLGESINLTIREGDVVIYFEKATPNRMMHVQQVIGSRAPLHVTAVGKLMLGMAGEDEIRSYAQRTNLPAYTRNTLSSLPALIEECLSSVKRGYALDNEEAEIDVGCIGVLLYDRSANVTAGLSVSAPIDRRKDAWVQDLLEAGRVISAQLGYSPAAELS